MTLSEKRRIAYAVTLGGYFGLMGLLFTWITLLRSEPIVPTSLLLIIAIGPLLFPLRGLLHGRPYTFAWASMISLLYIIHGIIELYGSGGESRLALAELLFSLSFYFGAVFYSRWRGRELKQLSSVDPAVEHLADKRDGESSLGDQ